MAVEDDVSAIFNWEALPACAQSCKILEISALNCVPPVAPVSNAITYKDCVCHSKWLVSLYTDGETCGPVCPPEGVIAICDYYKSICDYAEPSTFSQTLSATPSTAAAWPSRTLLAEPPATSAPTPTESPPEAPKHEMSWYHKNAKWAAIAGGSLGILILMIALAIICLRLRNQAKRKLERARRNRSIPLQPISPMAPPSRTHEDHWPHRAPPPYTSFSPTSPYEGCLLGETMREYASEREDVRKGSSAAVRSVSETTMMMEAIIQERIRTTGHPGLPISATPKIRR